MAAPSLSELPDEILHSILCYGSAFSATALEQTSTRFRNVANAPLLWRFYCQNDFKIWDQRHNIRHKLTQPVTTVDWKTLYKARHEIDLTSTSLLNSILARQAGRIEKIHRIIGFGYDAKDTLLRNAAASSDEEDHLARRYYSNSILGCLHRTMAIPEWHRLRNDEDVSLERVLGVFDMFVLGTGAGDFEDIETHLGEIVSRLSAERPDIWELSPRERAVNIAEYLRANNLTGIEPGREYYKVEHNFLGIALTNEGHNSLPLISAAIYCYVAKSVGLNANPCGFPFHVHAIIRPEPGFDLDGNSLATGEDGGGEEGEPMYMDPFRSSQETPVSELRNQLNFLGALTLSHATFLRESLRPEIALRCGKNILNSVLQTPNYRQSSLDITSVKYAALWGCMLFAEYAHTDNPGLPRQVGQLPLRRYLPSLMEHFATNFPLDVYLVEQYIIPLFRNLPEYEHLIESVHVMKTGDQIPKQVRRRTAENSNVRYEVGQVFRHRRYSYRAVIIGWDTECGAEEHWMQSMGVDRLQAGRHQSFYHVLVEDRGVRYVAEENIETVDLDIYKLPAVLVNLAGKYFKRWDHATRKFVSNVRDEYPDD